MRIAYLVIGHTDATHLSRLARRLSHDDPEVAVFVHVDAKSPERMAIERALSACPAVRWVSDPVEVWWGGVSAVDATWRLLDLATSHGPFDRYVLLQGLVYPIRPNADIRSFFADHRHVEFLRAVNLSSLSDKRLRWRIRGIYRLDRPNVLKRLGHRLMRRCNLALKPPRYDAGDRRWDFHWGNAEWALTGEFVRYLMQWRHDQRLRARFASVFAADETFFHTILFNSPFAARASRLPSEEREAASVTDLRNLVYSEYPDLIRVFEESAFDRLVGLPELFVRKVTTARSTGLLDRLDRAAGIAGYRSP